MIIPTKHISTQDSLLGIGGKLLNELKEPHTVTSLWNTVSGIPEVQTFHQFIMSLDFLYIIGAIDIQEGIIYTCQ